ncbi:MAG: hypothetical protein GAK45_00056 [Pseudomonas citronellolis]|nr:MAG: hypothetical protein GAK45_00056 [Pseudomonas citronellolis]
MRCVTLIFLFCAAGFGALLCAVSAVSGGEHLTNSAVITALFASISLISLAYALLILRRPTQGSGGLFWLLALYLVSVISGAFAGSYIGLIPYLMASMALSLVDALKYMMLSFLAFAGLSAFAYVLAYLYARRHSVVPKP